MRISEVARRTGIRPSAIRYYEEIGLLPPPPRIGGSRYFDRSALDYLTMIRFCARAGFTLRETRLLLARSSTRLSRRTLAGRKLTQLQERRKRLELAEKLISAAKLCQCGTVGECLARLRRAGSLELA